MNLYCGNNAKEERGAGGHRGPALAVVATRAQVAPTAGAGAEGVASGRSVGKRNSPTCVCALSRLLSLYGVRALRFPARPRMLILHACFPCSPACDLLSLTLACPHASFSRSPAHASRLPATSHPPMLPPGV